MHPADIQAALKKKGITQKQIAEELGVSQFHVSEVINDAETRRSQRVMRAVAEKIGLPVEEVFSCCFPPSPKTSPVKGEGEEGEIPLNPPLEKRDESENTESESYQ